MKYALILFLIGYSALEGVREYLFYKVNKAGKFPDRHSDKMRKAVNALVFTLVFLIAGISTELTLIPLAAMMATAYSIRWIVLDGLLNDLRNLRFFYVGTVAGTDTSIRTVAKWISVPPSLIMGIVKISALVTSVSAYIYLTF